MFFSLGTHEEMRSPRLRVQIGNITLLLWPGTTVQLLLPCRVVKQGKKKVEEEATSGKFFREGFHECVGVVQQCSIHDEVVGGNVFLKLRRAIM